MVAELDRVISIRKLSSRKTDGRAGHRRPPRLPIKLSGDKEGYQIVAPPRLRLNRTLIDRTTNHLISDRAPSDYLDEIRHTPGFPLDAVLASHCLPTGASSPFWTDDYDSFLDWRQKTLWEEIKRVTGIKEAADLEAGVEEAA